MSTPDNEGKPPPEAPRRLSLRDVLFLSPLVTVAASTPSGKQLATAYERLAIALQLPVDEVREQLEAAAKSASDVISVEALELWAGAVDRGETGLAEILAALEVTSEQALDEVEALEARRTEEFEEQLAALRERDGVFESSPPAARARLKPRPVGSSLRQLPGGECRLSRRLARLSRW